MNDSPLVSVIIPNFNGKHLLEECLLSLKNQNYEKIDIIVVDNDSSDGSADMVRKHYPWVNLIETERIGVAEACNKGMKIAKGDVIVTLLNNDMTVDKQCLGNMVGALMAKDVGVVCGKIYHYGTNRILSAGGWIDWNVGTGGQIGNGEEDKGQYDTPREVDYVDVPTIRRDVMKKVGGYDEAYCHYFIDTDYCVRAKQAGYKVMYIPSAVLWHRSSATMGGTVQRQYFSSQRDSLRFLFKHSVAPVIYYRLCCRTWYQLKKTAINLYERRPHLIILQVRALIWNLVNLKETLQSRYYNIKQRGSACEACLSNP